MENKAHALAAGLFVLLIAALTVALAIWLTRDAGVKNVYELTSREAVTGLQPQAAVRFKGVSVGKVVSIGFDPKVAGNVLVRISVDETTPVTTSTFGTLGFQGVTGLAFIALDDSGESKTALATSLDNPTRIPLRQGLLSKLTDAGTTMITQVSEATQRVNQLLSPENQKELVVAVQQLGTAASSVSTLSVNLDALLKAQLGPDRVNIPLFVQETRSTMRALQGAATEAGSTATELRKTATELTRTAQRFNDKGGPIDKLADGTDAFAASATTLNATTLPRINRASNDASRAARQASRAVNSINDNPQSLLFGSGAVPPGPGEPGFSAPAAKP